MAKILVEYDVRVKQVIDWPDDEMDDFNHSNLQCNCDVSEASQISEPDIVNVELNGITHQF